MIRPSAQELRVSCRSSVVDTLTKGHSLTFHSGQTQPSNEVRAMLADKE